MMHVNKENLGYSPILYNNQINACQKEFENQKKERSIIDGILSTKNCIIDDSFSTKSRIFDDTFSTKTPNFDDTFSTKSPIFDDNFSTKTPIYDEIYTLKSSIFELSLFNSNQQKNEGEEDENSEVIRNKLYCVPKHGQILKKTDTFKISNENRKRGKRKTKIQKYKRTHTKNTSDNILTKIQNHYLTFIVDYLNDILKSCNIKKEFFKFDHKLKIQIKKDIIESLKSKNIGEIVCNMKISNKYKRNHDEYYNIKLYDTIKENQLLNKIFSENYLTLFKKIYYTNKRKINLNEYGFNKEIILSDKVKTYKDLLLKNQDDQKKHNNSINGCIIQKFLSDSIFLVNYIN